MSTILVRPSAIFPVRGLRHCPSPSKTVKPAGKFGVMVSATNSAHSASVSGPRSLILRPKNSSATSMGCSPGSRQAFILIGGAGEGTLIRLRAVRRELIDPTIAEHRGRVFKTTVDGMLVEFASVVDAVRCAVPV